jgi:outer membrane receptor protein involved in Fe transport
MTKYLSKILLLSGCLLFAVTAQAQTTISGKVTDAETGEPLIGVNILVKGTVLGTITDVNGEFSLTVSSSPPLTLAVSSVGYDRTEIDVTSANATGLTIQLQESVLLGQEVVVSASRVDESILKSPVSVERMDILDIQNTASTDFYSALKNLNGVDFSTQSLTFQSVNARGFGANGNTRFVQLIDGIDNQAPGLNFPVGNVVGINELDLESAELIPGAASALYGPNAIQGILLMKSKSPFEYQGLDVYTKFGVNHVDEEDHPAALYRDMGLRYAKAFNNKWAFKLTASWLNAQDFIGVDYRDQGTDIVERSPNVDPGVYGYRQDPALRTYDGVNVYGDFGFNMGQAAGLDPALAPLAPLLPLGPEGDFSPTGHRERDFVDNETESLKFGTALHYRITDNIEAIGQFNIGLGSSVYTANDRFVLDDFSIWTGKIELRGSNFFLRAYTTQEDSGDTYAANTLASLINQNTYLPDYIGEFVGQRVGGATVDEAHASARRLADFRQQTLFSPGQPGFDSLARRFRRTSIADGGALFLDRSALYHYEGSYNFSDMVDFAEIIVGANFRTFALESEGTLFTLDENGDEISYNEFGGYIQIRKDIIDDVTVTASGRFDKSEFFEGQFTPRVAAVWEFLDGHNLRASFQTGFRIPTTQDQFIDLDVVTRRLIGRNEILRDFYNLDRNTVYTAESFAAAQQAGDPDLLEVATEAYEDYTPERVRTFEIGYKGLLLDGRLLVDAFFYSSVYSDLLAEITMVQAVATDDIQSIPAGFETGRGEAHGQAERQALIDGTVRTQAYGYDVNINEDVTTQGFGLGLEYSIGGGYTLGGR